MSVPQVPNYYISSIGRPDGFDTEVVLATPSKRFPMTQDNAWKVPFLWTPALMAKCWNLTLEDFVSDDNKFYTRQDHYFSKKSNPLRDCKIIMVSNFEGDSFASFMSANPTLRDDLIAAGVTAMRYPDIMGNFSEYDSFMMTVPPEGYHEVVDSYLGSPITTTLATVDETKFSGRECLFIDFAKNIGQVNFPLIAMDRDTPISPIFEVTFPNLQNGITSSVAATLTCFSRYEYHIVHNIVNYASDATFLAKVARARSYYQEVVDGLSDSNITVSFFDTSSYSFTEFAPDIKTHLDALIRSFFDL